MKIYIKGAAILRIEASASLRSGHQPMAGPGLFEEARLQGEFSGKFSRFGRYDHYTRMGCAAVFLALRDAGRDAPSPPRNIGFLLAGQYGSFETDLAYYRTTLDGELASPNLFSYTLPNIIIGECALQFGLLGPTGCLDAEGGRAAEALGQAALYLETQSVEAMLVGWLEARPGQAPRGEEGAMVLFFDTTNAQTPGAVELLTNGRRGLRFASGRSIGSLDDIFRALPAAGFASPQILHRVAK